MWKPETAKEREKEVSDATFQLDTIDVFLGRLEAMKTQTRVQKFERFSEQAQRRLSVGFER